MSIHKLDCGCRVNDFDRFVSMCDTCQKQFTDLHAVAKIYHDGGQFAEFINTGKEAEIA